MASAVAGDTLQFTSAQISSYAYPDGTNFKALTALQNVQQTESPSSTQVFNDNVVQVSVRFDNNGVNSAYLTQTIGLFAKIAGGEDPILFAVVTAITPDQMPVASSVSPTALIYNIQITIQSNANISVTVNPAGTATAEDVQYIKDNYIPTSAIENDLDLLDEDPDKVLGVSVGKELKSQIDALNTEIKQRIKVIPTNFEIYEGKTIAFEVTENGGCYIVMNCNRDLFAMVNISVSTPDLNKINIILNKQNIELNMSIQERIVTITASSALWGQTLVIGYNL